MHALILAAALALPAIPDAQLLAVTRQVNRDIRPMGDLQQYGRYEVYRVEPESGAGDCEDYALTKAWRLHLMGEPLENMAILTVHNPYARGPDSQKHAVLEVRGRVLDNMTPWLQRREHYAVLKITPVTTGFERARWTAHKHKDKQR
jgi:predicted transglutaminase-like cysteine proteinase